VTDRRENLRAIFDVEIPKEAGWYPFAARRRSVGCEPTGRQGAGNNFRSEPLRLDRPIRRRGTHPAAKTSPERHLPRGRRHGTERTTREGGEARNATERGPGREGSLEGEQGPGRTGCRSSCKRCSAVRTLSRSKDLRDSEPSGIGNSGEAGNGSVGTADDRGRSEVREGNGRGDTVRLRGRKVLRGVRTHDAGKPRSR
jgi:hypothetical protein